MDNHPNITSNDMTRAKDEKFAMWCKDYMNILRGSSSGPAKRSRQTCLPPGLNRPATSASLPPGATRSAVCVSTSTSKLSCCDECTRDVTCLFSIHKGPMELYVLYLSYGSDSGLVLGLRAIVWDRRLHPKDVVSTYQSNFWGPWWTYRMVPDEKKVAWWTSFLLYKLSPYSN
ncbi:hypothetical protein Bca52824_057276 [Brassica carinata]|uniref:Uncharacterized protein n=1 Tax=Brassica carinata TaxID=52824 RepID=A0A8X7QR67_BRACI|nr:hypothetical protein Bca52824_057276 [Brassica carinata]